MQGDLIMQMNLRQELNVDEQWIVNRIDVFPKIRENIQSLKHKNFK